MLLFGHTGLTLGFAVLLYGASAKGHALRKERNKTKGHREPSPEMLPTQHHPSGSPASWLISLGNYIDIRLLLIGSLLPDIIDKPIGLFFFRDTFESGRIFCHTFLFLFLISLAGLYLHRIRGKTWLLALSFGTFAHLIFDRMCFEPRTLLWPLYGFAFEKTDVALWLQDTLHEFRTVAGEFVPELVGAVILIWFALILVRRKKVYAFIRHGQLS